MGPSTPSSPGRNFVKRPKTSACLKCSNTLWSRVMSSSRGRFSIYSSNLIAIVMVKREIPGKRRGVLMLMRVRRILMMRRRMKRMRRRRKMRSLMLRMQSLMIL